MVSFNTTVRQVTKMSQKKWPKCFIEKKTAWNDPTCDGKIVKKAYCATK